MSRGDLTGVESCAASTATTAPDMTVYPYLPQADVAMTSAKTYLGLLTGAAS